MLLPLHQHLPQVRLGILLEQIQSKGEIVVAMEGTWAPWTYHDEDDNLVGYDVEVAQQIAEKLGVKATFVEGEWDGLLAGIDSGRYDIMVNGVDITEERAEKYSFSDPYAYNRTAVIVNSANDEIQSMEDLDGKSTANTISSTYAEVAEKYGATVTGVDDLEQDFRASLKRPYRCNSERRGNVLRLYESTPGCRDQNCMSRSGIHKSRYSDEKRR